MRKIEDGATDTTNTNTNTPGPIIPTVTPTIESKLPKNEPISLFYKIAALFFVAALCIIYVFSK
jgi:hypothetical protein